METTQDKPHTLRQKSMDLRQHLHCFQSLKLQRLNGAERFLSGLLHSSAHVSRMAP